MVKDFDIDATIQELRKSKPATVNDGVLAPLIKQ